MRQSLLDKDAQAVSNIFNNHISTLPFYHMPRDESGFHRLVHSLLKGMGFTVAGEMPGASGRLDICVELPGRVYILMGLKYRPTRNRPKPTLTPEEEDAVLTSLLVETLPADDVYGILAEVAMVKLDVAIRLRISKPNLPTEERNRRLAEALFYSFAAAEINKILASAARRIVPEAEIVAALDKRAPGAYLPSRRSGAISEAALTKASNQAVYDIAAREYRGVLALRAKRIVDLGLAIHGDKVKAVFGRDTDPSMPDEPPRRRERPGAKTLRS